MTKYVLLATLLVIFACQTPHKETEIQTLQQTADAFRAAVNQCDTLHICDHFTEDVIFMPNGWDIVQGKEDVCALWKQSTSSGFRTKNPKIVEIFVDGNTGYEVAIHDWAMCQPAQDTLWRSSKYVHLWKKQKGVWKLYLDIWNNQPNKIQ